MHLTLTRIRRNACCRHFLLFSESLLSRTLFSIYWIVCTQTCDAFHFWSLNPFSEHSHSPYWLWAFGVSNFECDFQRTETQKKTKATLGVSFQYIFTFHWLVGRMVNNLLWAIFFFDFVCMWLCIWLIMESVVCLQFPRFEFLVQSLSLDANHINSTQFLVVEKIHRKIYTIFEQMFTFFSKWM